MSDLIHRRQRDRGTPTIPSREPLARIQDVFDSFFAPIMRQWSGPLSGEVAGMRLWDFDLETNDHEVVVRAEMPGFEPNDIEVSVEENVLTIRAERHPAHQPDGDYRSYYRTVNLPSGIDPDHVTASCRHGVLELHLPRKEESKPRRIRIEGQKDGAEKGGETAPPKQAEPANSDKQKS